MRFLLELPRVFLEGGNILMFLLKFISNEQKLIVTFIKLTFKIHFLKFYLMSVKCN